MVHPIVECARGWLGTRFHHQGRIRKTGRHGGGVDCLGLLVGVAAELHLCGPDGTLLSLQDQTDYSHSPDGLQLRRRLMELLIPVAKSRMEPGDVLLLSVEGNPQHLAIASDHSDGLGMIHAYAPARCVVEHAVDAWWQASIRDVFRFYPA